MTTYRKSFLPASRQFTSSNGFEFCSFLWVLLLIFSKLGIPPSFKSSTLGNMTTPMAAKKVASEYQQLVSNQQCSNESEEKGNGIIPLDIFRHMERLIRPSQVTPGGLYFLSSKCTSMYTVTVCLVGRAKTNGCSHLKGGKFSKPNDKRYEMNLSRNRISSTTNNELILHPD